MVPSNSCSKWCHSRRRALAAGIGAVVPLSAGCATPLGGQSEPQIQIGQLHITSTHNQAHTVRVVISTGDTTFLDEQYELGAVPFDEDGYPERGETIVVELGSWHTEAADYTIRATLDSENSRETRLVEAFDTDCAELIVRVERHGTLAILGSAGCD